MNSSVSPDYMRRWEQQAFSQGISSLALMERAAQAILLELDAMVLSRGLETLKDSRLLFLCGPGNNGGDGYAAARLAHEKGAKVSILSVMEPRTPDAVTNAARCGQLDIPIQNMQEDIDFSQFDIIIDALFGTGLSRPAQGLVARLMDSVNQARGPSVLAVDIPSGIDGLTGKASSAAIRADRTITFQAPKHGLLLTDKETGSIITADIGLSNVALLPEHAEDLIQIAQASDLPALLPPRPEKGNKGTFGRVLLYAGSMGMAGAAAMAAKACLRSGAGLVTIVCGESIMPILQTLVPGATCCLPEQAQGRPYDVLAVGCGLGQQEETWQRILSLYDSGKPSVWDADALNMLAKHPMHLGENAVITPHPGEAARLLGISPQDVAQDALSAAKALRERYGASVLLKNAVSVLYDGNRMAFNTAGSSALAKGGSGDALCGILSGVLAQQGQKEYLRAMQAASLWLGLSARKAEETHGAYSVLTGDVIDCMGPALLSCENK